MSYFNCVSAGQVVHDNDSAEVYYTPASEAGQKARVDNAHMHSGIYMHVYLYIYI